MSYASKELSVQDALPVMLFQFVQGATYRYTTISETINRSGVAWLPAAIKCSPMRSTSEVPKDRITLELPVTNPLAATFVQGTPDNGTTVTVFRTHYDDTEVLTVWKGRVVNHGVDSSIVTLTCEPISTSLRRKLLTRYYQRPCPFVFGGADCLFDVATVTSTVTATAVSGTIVTVPTGAGLTNIEGGTLTYGGVTRMILKHEGTAITIMRGIDALALALAGHPEGVSVDVVQACSHDLDDPTIGCRARGNAGNYGGWLGIPNRNPMSNSITVVDA